MISLGPCIILIFLKIVYGRKYIINTTGCKIQEFNMTFYDTLLPKELTTCGERYCNIEKIAVNKIKFVLKSDVGMCCYSYLSRIRNEENQFTYPTCLHFQNQTIADLKGDIIAVECKRPSSYKDFYAIVQKKRTKQKAKKHSYNVLLLGLDTMSRKRVYNSMKETVDFLKKNEWLDFRGYNKIASNTLPNITPLLTGKLFDSGPTSFHYSCYDNTSSSACNDLFLWSSYRKKGYVTAFAEDSPPYVGLLFPDLFKTTPLPPTEHFIGPIFRPGRKNNSTSCSGKLSCGDHILNYALDFAETYKENKFFGFFWITTHSHDYTQSPMSFDKSVAEFFVNIKKSGVLDNTFVIFMSDHGIRFGVTRYKIGAYHDERLPMLFMHVPDKFKKNHRGKYTNLQLNEHRLISPFDLHLTIKNIMNLKCEPETIDACKNCMSLFQRVPENRKCADAGIDNIWCTCFELKETAMKEKGAQISVKKAAVFVEELSKSIPTLPSTRCHKNYLVEVLRVNTFNSNRATMYYLVAFVVNPAVVYEVIVRRFSERTEFRYDVVNHQMISNYGDQGDCVRDYYDHPNAYTCVCTKLEE